MRWGALTAGLAAAGLLWTSAVVPSEPALAAQAGPAAPEAAAPAAELSPMAKAVEAAKAGGRRVEIENLRSETAEVYANPDGTKTMEQHALPVRVRQKQRWVAPDATLIKGADGSIRPKAAVTPIVLSGGGSGHLLTIGRRGQRISMGWPGVLPAPRLDGDTATYAEVLPGVDLRIVVGVTDFQHLLVVKTRAAGANPALRTLHYPISSDSLKLSVRNDGTTVAQGKKGETVFTAPPPTMWDAAERTARLGIRLAGSTMSLTPDQKVLADPRTKYPVLIDPSIGGGLVNWLHVSTKMSGTDQGWTYDRNDEGAKMGAIYGESNHKYRSMFLMNTTNGAQTIAGSHVISATFRITVNKSPDGTKRPVQLWWLNDLLSTDVVKWTNQEGYWREHVATSYGEAYPHNEDNPIEFGNERLRQVLQAVADARGPQVSFGLRAENEGDQWQWKKFHPNTAVISITYNTPPRVPKSFNFTRPRPCATKDNPLPIATLQPQFAAIANDPDAGDNVTTKLQIIDEGGVEAWSSDVGPTVSGAAFSWPEVPADKLTSGKKYRYIATSRDDIESGATTPDCWFVVDKVKPATPVVVSSDFPNGEPVLQIRTAGKITFKIGAAVDTDVTEFLFGYQQDKMTMRVKAIGGQATIPATVFIDPATQTPSASLFVKAVDSAGNISEKFKQWSLQALDDNPPPVTRVRNDVNGDGRADITSVVDHGFGRTAVWNFGSQGDSSFYPGYIGWDSREGGGFNLYRTRPVQGDLDGDGRTDLALFREGAGRQIYLYKLTSDGNRYDAPPALWSSGPNGWPLSTARMIGGDVDGDGKADLVVQNAGSNNWSALVFRAANNFSAPTTWATSAAGNPWSASAPLLADIDGDKKLDLVSVRNLNGCRTTVDLYKSTGTGFAAAQTIYDSGAGNLCWEKSRPAVTDVDGDGKDDIVALYEYGASGNQTDAGLTVLRSTGTALTQSSWWRKTIDLDLSKATLTTGDYNADGMGDAAILYAGGTAPVDRQVFSFRSSGTAFADRVLGWQGEVGAVTGPKFDIEHREYELVNRNSGKCMNVLGGNVGNEAKYIQYTCETLAMHARFHIDQIAGTDQYALKPAHTATAEGPLKCADIGGWSMADGGELIQWPCGNGNGEATANQQVTLAYVDGASYDTVVQLKVAHSGKCLSIIGASPADLEPVKQETCGQAANQQWILRPTYNATQLGENLTAKYRTSAATSAEAVLDVENCQTEDGANVRMWDDVPGSLCESWKLQSLGDDLYKIVDGKTSKVLDLEGCSKLPAANVTLWTSNESECQLWRIEPSPGGSYSVIQAGTGLSMDVAGCNRTAHAEVITWFYHGGPCQRWIFQKR
ncbi:RICIN domain-containing protein [Kribbella sp. NPDC056345]|uniref:RICIN domain-containing protein n=1 Tax=Kribbella sp. NPDC056345 TaxID=3345789 RepID=UPI0035D6C8A9